MHPVEFVLFLVGHDGRMFLSYFSLHIRVYHPWSDRDAGYVGLLASDLFGKLIGRSFGGSVRAPSGVRTSSRA